MAEDRDYERAKRLRDQAARLRRLADDLCEEAIALERQTWGPDPLRGAEIAAVALQILRSKGPMHYRVLTAAVEDHAGRRIAGREPDATLLASIYRAPGIVSVGPLRSGVYASALDDTQEPRDA